MKKLSLVFLLILMASCSATNQLPTNIPARLPTFAQMPTVTAVSPTSTFTPTAALTLLPTWTPVPTLTDENSLLEFISFTENSICKLPCWAGIVSGKTPWEEATFALRPMESIAKFNTYLGVDGLFGKENVITWSLYGDEVIVNGDVGAVVSFRNIVNLINISVEGSSTSSENVPSHSLPLPGNFTMQRVLMEYGVPSMVFIYTFIHDEQGPLPFQVLLIYPEHQFYIEYHRDAELRGNTVVACDPDFYMKLTVLDSKEKLISLDSIRSAVETKDLRIQNMKPVEQVLSISPEKFHEIYTASATECMIFPSNLWNP